MSGPGINSELVGGFRNYGPAISGLYHCVARIMTFVSYGYEKPPTVPRELRQICDSMYRKRAILISEGTISANSWLPSYTYSQTNWVQSIWELLTSETIPEYVVVDAHLLFWSLFHRIEPQNRPDPANVEAEILQWIRFAQRSDHQLVLFVMSRLWPDSPIMTGSPTIPIIGRENLQRGLFLDMFKAFLKRNIVFFEGYAISGSDRPSGFPQPISRPTSSAGLESHIWTSPLMGMNSPEFQNFDTDLLNSDMDRLMTTQYGETSTTPAVDWRVSVSPPAHAGSYFPVAETYIPVDGMQSVSDPLSISPPLFGQLTPGIFGHGQSGMGDVYGHQSSSLHLAPVSGEGRPQSALLRRRSDRSPIRRQRRHSRSDEEEHHVHGWDAEEKICLLLLHTGEKCNTKVKTYNNFLRHCRFQHEGKEPREECTLCGQSFGRPDALRNHKEKSKKHKKLERLHNSR